jgi:serine/threonine protein kinase
MVMLGLFSKIGFVPGRISDDKYEKVLCMEQESNGSCSHLKQLGDYRIIKLLKTGGMGEVYLAEQMSMRRIVALKVLHPALAKNEVHLERFFREVKNLAKLHHPAVVQAIEAGVENGICYFSMSYVNGTDLKRLIMHEPMAEEKVLNVARDTAASLSQVWRRHGMIHRDIKPSNLMLTADGELKILDFGISKQTLATDDDAELTRAGALIGSPYYMSPEQARGGKLDLRADVYGLGATMYHLLTGQVPYEGGSSIEVVSLHISAPEPDLRKINHSVSAKTAALVRRMMAKSPDKRFLSWDKVVEAIDKILESEDDPETANQKKQQHIRRGILAACILVLIIVVATLGASFFKEKPQAVKPVTAPVITNAVDSATEEQDAKIAMDKQKKDRRRVKHTLSIIEDKTRRLEDNNKYTQALDVWRYYMDNGDWKDHPLFKKEARRAMDYYKEKINKQKKGLLNE